MAGLSVGELFVQLGFEVDDKKLKSFDDSMKSVLSTGLAIAGIGGGVAGLTALAKQASDTALTLDNLTKVYGINAQAAQAWGAAVHENNPLKSYQEGIASFGNIAAYLNNAAISPTGVMALNRLGVQYTAADRQNPEKALTQLFETIPKLLAAHPEQRGLYSKLVGDITGDPTNIGIFERGRGWYDKAAERATVQQSDLDRMVKSREELAALGNEWDKFVSHMAGTLATTILQLEKNINEEQAKTPGKRGFFAGVGRFTDWIGSQDPYGLVDTGKDLIHNPLMDAGVDATSKLIQDKFMRPTDHAMRARRFFVSRGWSDEQALGMVARLKKESYDWLDPAAESKPDEKGRTAYGIAQWRGSRQKDFEKFTGRPLRGSSFDQQLEFMNYELTKGNERRAGEAIRAAKTVAEAEKATRDKYERPGPPSVSLNVTQNIRSNGSPQEVANTANAAIARTVQSAYVQMIKGAR